MVRTGDDDGMAQKYAERLRLGSILETLYLQTSYAAAPIAITLACVTGNDLSRSACFMR